MQIENGDIVALTGATLLNLADSHPTVFDKLKTGQRTGGAVTKIDGNQITIDMGDVLEGPIVVEVDLQHPQLALQLVKKADTTALVPADTADQPDQPTPQQPQSLGGEYAMFSPFGNMQSGFVPPQIVDAIKEMAARDAESTANARAPTRVSTAQWVMTQFISLKQYVIVQDLNRDDEVEGEHVAPGDEWKQGSGDDKDAPVRRVSLQLSDAETSLYEASLSKIQAWIDQDDNPAPAVAAPTVAVEQVVPSIEAPGPVSEAEETTDQEDPAPARTSGPEEEAGG